VSCTSLCRAAKVVDRRSTEAEGQTERRSCSQRLAEDGGSDDGEDGCSDQSDQSDHRELPAGPVSGEVAVLDAEPTTASPRTRAVSRNRTSVSELVWTREHLARRAQVSLSLIAQFERGQANPSLATLVKLASAVELTLADLVATVDQPTGSISRSDPTIMWRSRDGSQASLVVAADGRNETELCRYVIAPGDGFDGEPHPIRSEVLIHVLTGELQLTVEDQTISVGSNAALRFRSHAPDRYANSATESLTFVLAYSREH
jgi:transcriptional regulator with XRE-family HTH domain